MAGKKVNVADGTTVGFLTSAFTSELTSFDWSGITREHVDSDHLGIPAPGAGKIANGTMLPSRIVKPGEISLELHFDPDQIPPVNGAQETVEVTFPLVPGDTTPAKWAALGSISDFSLTGEVKGKMTATAVVMLSGEITITAAT